MKILLITILLFFGIIFTFFRDIVIKARGDYEGKKGEFSVDDRKQRMLIGGIGFIILAIILLLPKLSDS